MRNPPTKMYRTPLVAELDPVNRAELVSADSVSSPKQEVTSELSSAFRPRPLPASGARALAHQRPRAWPVLPLVREPSATPTSARSRGQRVPQSAGNVLISLVLGLTRRRPRLMAKATVAR